VTAKTGRALGCPKKGSPKVAQDGSGELKLVHVVACFSATVGGSVAVVEEEAKLDDFVSESVERDFALFVSPPRGVATGSRDGRAQVLPRASDFADLDLNLGAGPERERFVEQGVVARAVREFGRADQTRPGCAGKR
jgi:hypothetical protein